MSVAFREIHRAQHRRRLRESTDLELIIAGRMLRDLVASAKTIVSVDGDRGEKFQVQLDDAIEEWRRQPVLVPHARLPVDHWECADVAGLRLRSLAGAEAGAVNRLR